MGLPPSFRLDSPGNSGTSAALEVIFVRQFYGRFFLQSGVPLTRKILINGRREEELRVAIVENQTLEDFEIETKSNGLLRNNIYRAVVSNIAPSLNAAFVDFGDVKNGFLAFNDVVESAYGKHVKDASKISDVLVPGQQLIVQVIKDATSLKGAQVTTNISLAGRYLVLRPKDAKSGISHKLDNDARADLTQKVRSLDLPEGYGCIVRTNAMDQSRAILLRDAKVLVQLWRKIEAEFAKGTGPQLLYNDQDIVVQVMRDYFDSTINEVLIDDKSCYERAKTYVRATIESSVDKIKLYEDKMPIFTRYGLEKQISQIYARMVSLPSGGFIVIDPTEALTAIDVNSAHATKRESQDLTAYHTNLEAAAEIGRQLRMRDIGGLIVVDFIDMKLGKHQRDVERVMRNAMARDKARIKVERISANGLLEINRQRLNQSLSQRTHLECPTCGGRGYIPSVEAIGMNLIREIDARAVGGDLGGVVIKLHPDIAQQVQNERRREFAQLELDYGIRIEIVASRDIGRGDESVEWLTKRQESELHPAKATTTSADAASIIDVAEAYTSESADDAYRPNDYEEFSSEEARKKRAAKRAARRESMASEQDVANVQEAETESKDVQPESRKSRSESRDSRSDKREIVAKEAKSESRDEKSADHKSGKKRGLPACVTGLIVLSGFIAEMQSFMHEDAPNSNARPHRRFNIRSRHKSPKVEVKPIQTDYRFFALDIARAVCVQWLGLTQDAPKKDVLAQFEEVSQWLLQSTKQPKDEIDERVEMLRSKMVSRHATARLDCLFDDESDTQPDELAQSLLETRDAVLGNCKKLDEAIIRTLNGKIHELCSRVFDKQPAAMSEDKTADMLPEHSFTQEEIDDMIEAMTSDAAAIDSATRETDQAPIEMRSMDHSRRRHTRRNAIGSPENAEMSDSIMQKDSEFEHTEVKAQPETSAAQQNGMQLAVNQPMVHRHNRRTHRRAIGEMGISPFAGENAEIISADVPILPMTLEKDDIQEAAETEDNLEQAITQELPAIRPSRRERRTRRMREPIAVSEAQAANTIAEESKPPKQAAPVEEKQPEKEDISDIDTSEMLPRVERRETRRIRKTRDRHTPHVQAEAEPELNTAPVEMVQPIEMSSTRQDANAEADLAQSMTARKPRERRRSERAHIGTAPAHQEVLNVVETPIETPASDQEITPVVAPVAVDMPKRRVRKTRPARTTDQVADKPAEVAAQPVEMAAEPVQSSEPAEAPKRRVRKTRRSIENAATQEPAAETAVAMAEPEVPAESAAPARRVRRTRRSPMSE